MEKLKDMIKRQMDELAELKFKKTGIKEKEFHIFVDDKTNLQNQGKKCKN